MSNHHADYAEALLEEVYVDLSPEGMLAKAQVRATLALVEEQRTANLIAAWQSGIMGTGAISFDNFTLRARLSREIRERLDRQDLATVAETEKE